MSRKEFGVKQGSGISTVVGPAGPAGPAGIDGADGADGVDGADGTVTIIDLSYAELISRSNAGASNPLTKGEWYRITDFRTRHDIPNTSDTHTEAIEPLIISCLQETTSSDDAVLTKRAYSGQYPQDIIYYDPKSTSRGADRGVITYRKDTQLNLETYYDFRGSVFRRWVGQFDTATTTSVFGGYKYSTQGLSDPVPQNRTVSEDFYTFENTRDGHTQTRDVALASTTYNVVLDSALSSDIDNTSGLSSVNFDQVNLASGGSSNYYVMTALNSEMKLRGVDHWNIEGIFDSYVNIVGFNQPSTITKIESSNFTSQVANSTLDISISQLNYSGISNSTITFTNVNGVGQNIIDSNLTLGSSIIKEVQFCTFDGDNCTLGNIQNVTGNNIENTSLLEADNFDFDVIEKSELQVVVNTSAVGTLNRVKATELRDVTFSDNVTNFKTIFADNSQFNSSVSNMQVEFISNSIFSGFTFNNNGGGIVNCNFTSGFSNNTFRLVSGTVAQNEFFDNQFNSMTSCATSGRFNDNTFNNFRNCNIGGDFLKNTANNFESVTFVVSGLTLNNIFSDNINSSTITSNSFEGNHLLNISGTQIDALSFQLNTLHNVSTSTFQSDNYTQNSFENLSGCTFSGLDTSQVSNCDNITVNQPATQLSIKNSNNVDITIITSIITSKVTIENSDVISISTEVFSNVSIRSCFNLNFVPPDAITNSIFENCSDITVTDAVIDVRMYNATNVNGPALSGTIDFGNYVPSVTIDNLSGGFIKSLNKSTLREQVDMTGVTNLSSSNAGMAPILGEITIQSSNATETLNTIDVNIGDYSDITIRPIGGLVLTVNAVAGSSATVGEIVSLLSQTYSLDDSRGDYIVLRKSNFGWFSVVGGLINYSTI